MKKSILLGVIALIMLVLAVPVMAVITPADSCTLNFVQKTEGTWVTVPGATGTMVYDTSSFSFTGYGLGANTGYTLISYAEPYPGTGSVVLGTGTTNGAGGITITGVMPTLNYYSYTSGEYSGQNGAKIWLVPTADFSGAALTAWTPSSYLFETRLILINEVCENDRDADVVITGSIAEVCPVSLEIAVETTQGSSTDFGTMIVGENNLPNAGNLQVTSMCTAWAVGTPATTPNAGGYMSDGSKVLAAKILQKDVDAANAFVPVISDWSGFDGIKVNTLWAFDYPLAYRQIVGSGDPAGNYGITVTYSVAAV